MNMDFDPDDKDPVAALVSAYLDGELTAAQAADFERRLANDDTLRAALALERAAREAVRDWLETEPPGAKWVDLLPIPPPVMRSVRVAGEAAETPAEKPAPTPTESVPERPVTARKGTAEPVASEAVSEAAEKTEVPVSETANPEAPGEAGVTVTSAEPAEPAGEAGPAAPVVPVTPSAPREPARPRRVGGFWRWAAAAVIFFLGVAVGQLSPCGVNWLGTAREWVKQYVSAPAPAAPLAIPAPPAQAEFAPAAAPAPAESERDLATARAPRTIRTTDENGRLVIETTLAGTGTRATWVVDGSFQVARK